MLPEIRQGPLSTVVATVYFIALKSTYYIAKKIARSDIIYQNYYYKNPSI